MSKKIKIILFFVVALIIFFTSWFVLSNQEEKELKLAQKWADENGLTFFEEYPDWVKPLPGYFRKYFRQRVTGIYREKVLQETLIDQNGVITQEIYDLQQVEEIDLAPLQNLKYLKTITIEANLIKNFAVLKNLNYLESLEVSGSIDDISAISNLKNLKILMLENEDISDLKPLRNLKNLEKLYLVYSNVVDLSPLYNLKKLILVDLVRCRHLKSEDVEKLKLKLPECKIYFINQTSD